MINHQLRQVAMIALLPATFSAAGDASAAMASCDDGLRAAGSLDEAAADRTPLAVASSLPPLFVDGIVEAVRRGTTNGTADGSVDAAPFQGSPAAEADDDRCRLYLAESSIPNAGLGMFTAVDLSEGDDVGYPGVVVPIVDMSWHGLVFWSEESDGGRNFIFDDYNWDSSIGVHNEADEADIFSPGFGAAANCDMGLANIKEGDAVEAYYRSSSSSFSAGRGDPSAGAFSSYDRTVARAEADVPAGAELFVNYGEGYFDSREKYDDVPRGDDYDRAEEFVDEFRRVVRSYDGAIPRNMTLDLLDALAGAVLEPRVRNAFPRGGKLDPERGLRRSAVEGTIRSAEWLERNGKCMDNIRPGASTVPHAGRGAFAARPIPARGLVAPAPLLHIPRRDVLNMYRRRGEEEDDDGEDGEPVMRPDPSDVRGKQLLLNYCFGHADSTVLLCPYGAVTSFINHDGEAPNAKIQWADGGASSATFRREWLEEPAEALESRRSAGLAFDVVATHDIHAGEEIFIDYGPEWEEAWNAHVAGWTPPDDDAETFVRSSELNADAAAVVRTEREQRAKPYPTHVETHCRYDPEESEPSDGDDGGDDDGLIVRRWSESDALAGTCPCAIKSRGADGEGEREASEPSYAARVFCELVNDEGEPVDGDEIHILTHIPRRGIVFQDARYSGDAHLPGAFRHEMMIPDDVFPEAWRNK